MKPRQFFAFVAPSLLLMFVFIAIPLATVLVQSFVLTQNKFETVTRERCTPGFFGGEEQCTTVTRNVQLLDEAGRPVTESSFVGLEVYEAVLQPDAVGRELSDGGRGITGVLDIPFWGALRFTLTFTFLTLPLVIGVGLLVAMTVNNTLRSIRGPVIFVSLLPFIITPVIGALSIRWLFIGDGIMTAFLEWLTDQNISMFAQGWTIEILMHFYRVWHVAPFAFVIFYAGLQTVNQDYLDAAVVDGASRWQRLRYIIIPHLMPLIVFVALIHLMDAYRVFEEVIGFSSQGYRISLQWLTFNFLEPDDAGNRSVSAAAASSMLTMVGIVILLIPLLRRTWREYR